MILIYLRFKFNVNTEKELRGVVGEGYERGLPIWSIAVEIGDQEIRSEKMLLRYKPLEKVVQY